MNKNINKETEIIKVEIRELKTTITEVNVTHRCPLFSTEGPQDRQTGSLSQSCKSHEFPGGGISLPLRGFGVGQTWVQFQLQCITLGSGLPSLASAIVILVVFQEEEMRQYMQSPTQHILRPGPGMWSALPKWQLLLQALSGSHLSQISRQLCIPTIFQRSGSKLLNHPTHLPGKPLLLQTSSSTWKVCPAQSKRALAFPMVRKIQAGDTVPTVRYLWARSKDPSDIGEMEEQVVPNTHPSTEKSKGTQKLSVYSNKANTESRKSPH